MTEVETRNVVSRIWGEALRKPNWQSIEIWVGDKKTVLYNQPDESGVSGLDRFLKCFDWEKKTFVTQPEWKSSGSVVETSGAVMATGFSAIVMIMICY